MATYSYFKKGKVRLLKDPDLTDVDTDSSSDEETAPQQQTIDSFWCWDSDDGYVPYDPSVSTKLEQLNIGEIYKLYINNTNYEIKKIASGQAIQTNMSNNLYRKAIRQANNNSNNNIESKSHNYESKSKPSNNNKNNMKELQYVWFYSLNSGALESLDYNTSIQLNKLKIGGLYKTHINGTEYIFTKSADDICQQRNGSTNECQTVIRQSMANKNKNKNNNQIDEYRKHKNNHAWTPPNHNSHQNIHKKKSKWYWKNDNEDWQPLTDTISSQLNSLTVMKTITVTIHNSKYEMMKLANDIVQQKNINSGNLREIRRNVM